METTPATPTGSNKMTIAIIAIIVVIVLGVGAYLYNKSTTMPAVTSGGGSAGEGSPASAGGNDYVSGSALNKRKLSNYPVFIDLHLTDRNNAGQKDRWAQYDRYWGKIEQLFGDAKTNEQFVTGFMKGMNLELTRENVLAFKDEIQQYLSNPNKIAHWDGVTIGQFLK